MCERQLHWLLCNTRKDCTVSLGVPSTSIQATERICIPLTVDYCHGLVQCLMSSQIVDYMQFRFTLNLTSLTNTYFLRRTVQVLFIFLHGRLKWYTLISWIWLSSPPMSAYVSCGAFSTFITVTKGSVSSISTPITAWTYKWINKTGHLVRILQRLRGDVAEN